MPSVFSIYFLLDDNSSVESYAIFISGPMCDQEKHFNEASAFFLKKNDLLTCSHNQKQYWKSVCNQIPSLVYN